MNCDQHLDKNSEESLTTSKLRFARALNKKLMKNHVFNMSKFEIQNSKFRKDEPLRKQISMLKTFYIQHTKMLNVTKTLKIQRIHDERRTRSVQNVIFDCKKAMCQYPVRIRTENIYKKTY